MRSRTARFEDFSLAAAFAVSLGMCAALAFGYCWLLKPTVFENRGLAAYKPPVKTVISAVPWVPPEPGSEVFTSFARAEPAAEPETKRATPKDEKSRETAQAPRRVHAVRARPAPAWNGFSGRSWGWRPWF